MANYDSNYEIAQEISARIGNSPIPFDSVYSICLEIYRQLGGEEENFDSVYSILLEILPLVEGGGANVIDDTSIRLDKTWSSSKINSEIEAHSGATYTAGQNISIDASNAISADGYVFDETNGSFVTKYLNTDEDESYIATNTASGEGAFAEGYGTTATGMGNHAEGGATQATGSQCAHAEGLMSVASGKQSHAEGNQTIASGKGAHAEGGKLSGQNPTTAAGSGSHAEGQSTLASGQSSHTEGELTEAKNGTEHAQGNCNLSHKNSDNYGDAGNTIDSIGIGNVVNNVPQRKNALEVMQNGDYYLYGVGGYQGTDTKVQNASILTLQDVVNGKADAYEVATTADIEALFTPPTPAPTAPADDEIWYTTESGNVWAPYSEDSDENTLERVNSNALPLLSNTYQNGHGVLKYSDDVTELDYEFGANDKDQALAPTDLTSLTLPHSITSVSWLFGGTAPQLEAIYYNGTVAECEEINWYEYMYNVISEITCLDGTYTLPEDPYGGGY